jgi:hypothetical protein
MLRQRLHHGSFLVDNFTSLKVGVGKIGHCKEVKRTKRDTLFTNRLRLDQSSQCYRPQNFLERWKEVKEKRWSRSPTTIHDRDSQTPAVLPSYNKYQQVQGNSCHRRTVATNGVHERRPNARKEGLQNAWNLPSVTSLRDVLLHAVLLTGTEAPRNERTKIDAIGESRWGTSKGNRQARLTRDSPPVIDSSSILPSSTSLS